MSDVLLSVSNSHVFFKGKAPVPAPELHKPFFWSFAPQGKDTKQLRRSLLQWHAQAQEEARSGSGQEQDPLTGIDSLGPIETVESFWRGNASREAFKVFTRHPGLVPRVSDAVFDRFDAYTAEHDVPYQQRLAVDLAANGHWPFATGGKKTSLTTMVFDIETTQFGNEGVRNENLPIDVLGYAAFDFTYTADVELAHEEFDLDIVDAPQDWQRYKQTVVPAGQVEADFVVDPGCCDIVQEVARGEDEELQMLLRFCRLVPKVDVLSGHNTMGFDNLKIHERLTALLEKGRRRRTLSVEDERTIAGFLDTYLWKDKSYQFGRPDDVAVMHPSSLDTLLAARRFYFYRDDFTLKALAPYLGINIDDREYVEAQALDINKAETLRYHMHDIQEQLGLSMHFMLQAVPLAFSTGMTFEQLFQGMNTKMWDHIGLIRGAYRKRLMPATCRAQAIAATVQRRLHMHPTKDDIVRYAKGLAGPDREGQSGRELMRVAKYGDEMPEWVEYPYLISDVRETSDDANGYAIAGGMTLHPGDLGSHFVPWWHVVAADVGAMYPTILKALNVGADTVSVARKGEKPDAWIWLKRADAEFVDSGEFVVREPGEAEAYADHGVMIGIRKRDQPGVVNLGMTAILGMIAKTKKALAEAKKPSSGADPEHIKRLQLNYQSLKAARNAGTHGILVAVNVSCRQFNLLAGAHITTEGQRILHESLRELNNSKIRVVYGDTDGIYIGCGRNGANIPEIATVYNAEGKADPNDWMTTPEQAIKAVDALNKRFRSELNYQDFELEPEVHDAMVFVVHKNYLIFDAYDGKLHMETKGNNFKGSDKADLARDQLAIIMHKALGENLAWKDEEGARKGLQTSIKKATLEQVAKLRLATADQGSLILLQTVRPSRAYKEAGSTFAKRSDALDELLRKSGMEGLRSARKFRFVVANRPLPGLESPTKKKPGIKPIEFMWPVEVLERKEWKDNGYRIDLDWYKEMLENYVKGAFGFDDLSTVEQKGLDAWL